MANLFVLYIVICEILGGMMFAAGACFTGLAMF